MASAIKEQVTNDMKDAMRAHEKEKLGVIRLILAAFKQREVDERIILEDSDVLAILEKMSKQRRESIEQFQKAERTDLADKEKFELEIIQSYLPAQLPEAEIADIVKATVANLSATSIKDMGKVMGVLKPQLQGKADMAKVGELVKSLLG